MNPDNTTRLAEIEARDVRSFVSTKQYVAEGAIEAREDRRWLLERLREAMERERWVPVTERLPDHDGYYEVSSNQFWPPFVYVLEFRDAEYAERGHWCAQGDFHGYVIAWREPPAPYEQGETK